MTKVFWGGGGRLTTLRFADPNDAGGNVIKFNTTVNPQNISYQFSLLFQVLQHSSYSI